MKLDMKLDVKVARMILLHKVISLLTSRRPTCSGGEESQEWSAEWPSSCSVGALLNPRTGTTRNGTKTEHVVNARRHAVFEKGRGLRDWHAACQHGYRHCCCGRETVGKASLWDRTCLAAVSSKEVQRSAAWWGQNKSELDEDHQNIANHNLGSRRDNFQLVQWYCSKLDSYKYCRPHHTIVSQATPSAKGVACETYHTGVLCNTQVIAINPLQGIKFLSLSHHGRDHNM